MWQTQNPEAPGVDRAGLPLHQEALAPRGRLGVGGGKKYSDLTYIGCSSVGRLGGSIDRAHSEAWQPTSVPEVSQVTVVAAFCGALPLCHDVLWFI